MKIHELLAEEQLDELSLKGLGTGIGKAIGAVPGAALQGAKNVWSGVKQGWGSGQQALKPDQTPTQGTKKAGFWNGYNDTVNASTSTSATNANSQQPQSNGQQNNQQQTTPASNQQQASAPANSQQLQSNGQQNNQQQTTPASNQQQQGGQQVAATPNAKEKPAEAPAMKADEIASELNDVWKKATANQGSMTSDGKVKQQIVAMAKDAGMSGMKIENKLFHSKFLGIDL
jgi:pyruvate/2-oxoglutarate dehydrogenase complex dihydrolipoamide acyltransferase (E2) component